MESNLIQWAQYIPFLIYKKIMHSVFILNSHDVIMNRNISLNISYVPFWSFWNVIMPDKMDTLLCTLVSVPIWEIFLN